MKCCDFKVFVRCFTFNQSVFIADAMNGFVKQKTNFPFVVVIVDDASSDGTQNVVREYIEDNFRVQDTEVAYTKDFEYGHLLFAQHKLNASCFFAFLSLNKNHYKDPALKRKRLDYLKEWTDNAQYIAYCEGDDYWTDESKLQKQVDFLDEHDDYTACFHNAVIKWENHEFSDKEMCSFKTGTFTTAQIFEKWQLPLASLVFRKEVERSEKYLELIKEFQGGFCFFIAASVMGKTWGFSNCMSVYRKNLSGVSNSMGRSYCYYLDLRYAVLSGDKNAVDIVINKCDNSLIIPDLLNEEKYAVNVFEMLKKYKCSAIIWAYFKYVFFTGPKLILKSLLKMIFRKNKKRFAHD